ncbi:sensor histidine kinase [Pontiella sulfatireligans]|uniref:Sensor histidine kinase DesK n=1 Tax=Pontiella sulfatireligans TaxID=2750658 RepID=A0A6C2UIS3_9BACT|nr:histidine kinase [Pontiella sulfatireligans]VGO19321.1 Sensor histidine kinase DesK [Pontiella sulfatireligans]
MNSDLSVSVIKYRSKGVFFAIGIAFLLPHGSVYASNSESSSEIKNQIAEINLEIDQLPTSFPSVTPWTMGFLTTSLSSEDEQVTIDIEFPGTNQVDMIALMPAAHTEDGNKLYPLGFPLQFFIERILPDGSSEIIIDHRNADYLLKGIEPQIFPVHNAKPTTAIRITTTRAPLNKERTWVNYEIAFSEVFIFENNKNIALNAKVTAPKFKFNKNIWSPEYLVDGFSLFSPTDQKLENQTRDFIATAKKVTLLYDLGTVQQVDELRLWPTSSAISYTLPPFKGFGFPSKIHLELLGTPHDPSPRTLFQTTGKNRVPRAGPFMHTLPPAKGRYFRLTLSDPIPGFSNQKTIPIGLDEFELLHKGQPLTHGLIPQQTLLNQWKERPSHPIFLTDGLVTEGTIIPLRQWVEQYPLKIELQRLHTTLQAELNGALARERIHRKVIAAATIVFIVFLILMIWLVRLLTLRRAAHMREQIACDLHDEVGANLSSISHSSELVKELAPTDDEMLSSLLDDITQTSQQTAAQTQQFIRFLEERQNGIKIRGHIKAAALQILGTMDFECIFDDSHRPLNKLNPTQKWDLLFFVKEALNNVIKHAEADRVEIETQLIDSKIILTVSDNGQGIPENRLPLRHLESRAERLNATMIVETKPEQGSRIILTIPKRVLRWPKQSA